MRWLLPDALVLSWLTWSLASVACGQLVGVGPTGAVHIRAPFVRVDVGPDGRTAVRAPFTSVDVPGRRYITRRPHADTRYRHGASVTRGREPTLADPSLASWDALWRMLDSATIRLDEQLGRSPRASGWQEYLQTSHLREILSEQSDGIPDPQMVGHLRDILARFERTTAVQHYRPVSSLSGFRTVHVVLKELVSPPVQRDRRRLGESVTNLERELMHLDNGRRWVRHLQLPQEVFVSQSLDQQQVPPPPDTDPSKEPELGHLIEALARFDAISHDPEYQMIAGMQAFQTTRKRLDDYVRLLSETHRGDASRPPHIEELPVPQPEPR